MFNANSQALFIPRMTRSPHVVRILPARMVGVGGFGCAVMEHLHTQMINTPVVRIGWPDQFIEHGTNVDDLRKKHGLTAEKILEKIRAQFAEAPVAAKLIEVA